MEITFFKNNLISGEHEVSVEQIIKGFMSSELYQEYRDGIRLEHALLKFMSSFGSFDVLTDRQWAAIFDELNLRELLAGQAELSEHNAPFAANTDLVAHRLKCPICSNQAKIIHLSNWHNGTGTFSVQCDPCQHAWNVRWKLFKHPVKSAATA